MTRFGLLLTFVALFGALALREAAVAGEVALDDLIFETQINPDASAPGCNSVSVLSFQGGSPVFQLPRPDDADLIDGFAATTDFHNVYVLASSSNPARLNYSPQLLHLVRGPGAWSEWSMARPVTGARLSYDRSFTILPDDETLLVEEWGPLPHFDRDSFVGKYCLSEIDAEGSLGPRRGIYHGETTPRQIIASSDGRHAYLIGESSGSVIILDAVTMQPEPTIAGVWHNGDAEPHNEFLGGISPDEHYIVNRRHVEDALGVVDLVNRDSWLLPMKGLCGGQEHCGEAAFNHASLNHGLLAVHGQTELAVFEFVPNGPLRKLGRLPLSWNPSLRWMHLPLAWSGDGQYLAVGTQRPNGDEILIVRVENGGRKLTEHRVLTGCLGSLGRNRARVLLTANRRLARVTPAVPCAPPTPTPTNTARPTPTPSAIPPSRTPSPSPSARPSVTTEPTSTTTATNTASPIPSATSASGPVYLPLLLRENCKPSQRRINFVLVLDLSSSMLQQTAAGRSKLAAAVEAAQRFLDTIHLGAGDQAALVAFNAEAWLITPLTDNRADLDAGFAGLATAQFTRIDRGIAVAQEELAGSRRRGDNLPVMVVLTDGRNNPVPVQAAVDQAQEAKAAGTQLFTIGIGQDLEVSALAQMASRPEWFYVAPDAEDLGSIYLAIAEAIPCPGEGFWGSR